MSVIQKIFAYNTGSLISGTTQVGDIAVSEASVEYSDNFAGLQWWGGPDETIGYVIAHVDPTGGHNGYPGIPAYLGFWRGIGLTDSDFLELCNSIPPRIGFPPFTNTTEAYDWLNSNGYWTSFYSVTPTPTSSPISTTPTPTPTVTNTPTATDLTSITTYTISGCTSLNVFVANLGPGALAPGDVFYFDFTGGTPSGCYRIVNKIDAVPTDGTTPLYFYANCGLCEAAYTTPTPTPTITSTQTPTVTPTPSSTQTPITGYSFNLVVLPYNYPSSGNTIMVDQSTPSIGTTNPNVFATTNNGIYFNAIDTSGVNRTNYFASFTGQSITLTISQTGSTAIYSGDSKAFQSWTSGGDSGFTFGYGIAQPGYSAGTTTLIQSAPTNWVTGQTVTISAVVNGAGVTPTPTATSVTPTPTPTSGGTGNFNVTISQQGPDVVWNGSGYFNLAALGFAGSNTIGAGFAANTAIWAIGPTVTVDTYSGTSVTYPTSMGIGGVGVSSASGSTMGILPGGSGRLLYVPSGYTSNSVISGSATYNSQTVSGMGLSGGTYTWVWTTGGNSTSVVMNIVP